MASGSSRYYQHKDWLGNVRLSSGTNSSAIIGDYAYAPYGERYNIYGSTNANQLMFTGDTQDVLAGMYDTPNRELQGAQQGRWLSPDPARSGWNQYAYPTNPNSSIDPSGLNMCPARINGGCNPGLGGGGDNEDLGGTGMGPVDNLGGLGGINGNGVPLSRGPRFFSRSAFRSGLFLSVTALCLVGVLSDLYIVCKYWHALSPASVTGFWIFACGLIGPWWRALRYHERMQQLYLEGSVSKVEAGSAMDVALNVAAGGMNDSLFFCFATMLAMLRYIDYLLSQAR